jgi:oxygen-dependent protoporphyrinogen oxidase
MIGIIGAGISGLTLAYELKKRQISFRILEASRVGGYLQSEKIGNYLLDYGANSLLCDRQVMDFIHEIGLGNDIIFPNAVSKHRYIFKGGKYQVLPASPPSLLFGDFFSWKTKWAIFKERNRKVESNPNETLSQFFGRRFSQEIVDYALNPFVSGIYAGNPYELLLDKTFPILADYEKNYGSVLKGFLKNSNAERRQSINFRNGIQSLPQRLAEKIGDSLEKKTAVEVLKTGQVLTENEVFSFDQLVITAPAFATATLLQNAFPDLASALAKVRYPPMTVVYTAFKKNQVGHHLNGFGGLNPKVENQFSAGSIWTSSLFPDRCPEDEVLLTSFVGGTQYAENALMPDEKILEKLNLELSKNYQILGKPVFQHLYHWAKSIPQYDQAINVVYKQIELLASKNIFFCTNWKDGISVADCIKKAIKLAEKLK